MKSKILYLLLIVFLASGAYTLEAGKKTAKGIVFEDTNRNGVFDKGEKGIANVPVSNQVNVVQTDQKGHFRLPVSKETIIFVTKPAGYQVPLDKNNFPRFYYIHQPKGSPAGLKYKGIAPTGKLPRSIHFPLIKTEKDESFDVIVVADPQTRTREEVDYYRDDVVARLMGTKARFYLALGDIMYDYLNLFDRMIPMVGQIGIPIYHVIGNHDMNYRVPDEKYEAETFKRFHGPDYFSFNYGSVHFVVLNSIKYNGWNNEKNEKGDYIGYLHERQLTWLKNDLSVVPEDHLLVLAMHIPVKSGMYKEDYSKIVNNGALFKILEKRKLLLALAGHMHYSEYLEFDSSHGWLGSAKFPSLIAGAGCGTWWHGPKNPMGIPFGICTDGTPNGYFRFTFTGNRFNYRFCPSHSSHDSQMRINYPRGTLTLTDLKNLEINVNVFTGDPGTMVTYELDDGPKAAMERKIMKDPFFTKLVKENPDKYKDWMEPTDCPHIWVAPLPENLEPGNHRLKITAADHQGNVYTAYRLFEIIPVAPGG
jgi:hypothetical protein